MSPRWHTLSSATINQGSGLKWLKPTWYGEEGYKTYNLGHENSNGGFRYGRPGC